MNEFDKFVDRRNTPSAKFNPAGLQQVFGTTDLYPFWVADEDFRSPDCIVEALIEKAEFGVFGYEYKPQSFFEAFESWYSTRYGYPIDRSIIQPSPTIMTSVAMALDLFTKEGDGVIIQSPVYMEFQSTIKKTGRKVVDNPLIETDGRYRMDLEDLRAKAADTGTKVMMLCNPHNPGGRVWTREELQNVVDICLEYNILIVADEIHADVILPGHHFTPMLSFEEMHNQLIVCYSPAKVFNIAAICDSFALIPNEKMRADFNTLRLRYNLGRTNAFGRIAMEEGFRNAGDWVDKLNHYIQGNVDFIHDFIEKEIPEIKLMVPEGTYLVWLDVRHLPLKGEKLIRYLASEAKVGLNKGEAFGKHGRGYVRMNIACTRKTIEGAMQRLKVAVENINSPVV